MSMKTKTILLVAAGVFFAPITANATTLIATQQQTVDGQAFSFSFLTTDKPVGEGVLSFRIRGDFTASTSQPEFFDYNFDGLLSATGIQATAGNILVSYGVDDNEFLTTFALSNSLVMTALTDNIINLNVQYGPGVGYRFSADPFITASIEFAEATAAVPEPVTWTMMLIGFGLVAGATRYRRRKTSAIFA